MSYYNFQYNKFYYSTLCHVCKKYNPNLKRCSTCKAVAYCSKDHQKQDWKLHKNLCKAIAKSDNKLEYSTVHSEEDFRKYNISRSLLWHKELSRDLLDFECQIWMFPRVCALCFSKNVVIDCPICLNVSYCSVLHKTIHEDKHCKFCKQLKLCMDIDLYYFHGKHTTPEVVVSDFAPEVNTLPNSLQELMNMYVKDKVSEEKNLDKMIEFIINSNLVAPAANILYGMEKSGLLKDRLFSKPNLTVHIVGAEITEMSWLWKLITELPFHWIKNLKSLDFYLVGPELNHEGITEKFAQQLCESCKARQPATKIIFHWKLYHEVAHLLGKPDIVVAFNSGIHEFGDNSWQQSIDCLTMHSNVPLLLTAYMMDEIKRDVHTVKSKSSHKVDTILEPQKNPFCNMRPIRNWEAGDNPVFYVNGYISILKAE